MPIMVSFHKGEICQLLQSICFVKGDSHEYNMSTNSRYLNFCAIFNLVYAYLFKATYIKLLESLTCNTIIIIDLWCIHC